MLGTTDEGSQGFVWQILACKGQLRAWAQGCEGRGPTLHRGTGAPGQVASRPECSRGPAAPGAAASSRGQAAFLSYTTVSGKGGQGSRYQQKGRNRHLNFIVLSSESRSVPQYPDLQTCNDAVYLPHQSSAKLDSLVFVAYFKTLS